MAAAALDLRPLGIDFCGTILEAAGLARQAFPVAVSISGDVVQRVVRGNGAARTFTLLETIYEGNHGRVEAVSDESAEVLFRKVPTDGNTLECEALFQITAHGLLQKYGLGHMIAGVRDIYCDPRAGNLVVFTMEPFMNIELLSDALTAHDFTVREIVGIIAQVALALRILDEKLDMNHRDLKTTNILVERCCNMGAKYLLENIEYAGQCFSICCPYKVHLVDFGFACTGNRRRSFVNAGNFFPLSDPCPKTGRDIFQLLTTMFLCTRFQALLEEESADSVRLLGLFQGWLMVPNNDYIGFLKTIGSQSIDWVYLMLGSDKFYAPSCASGRVLEDIWKAFPDIVASATASANADLQTQICKRRYAVSR
jgi:serine/threonine protein kinase